MSWLFSEAMMKAYGNLPSSQERVEEFSEATCSAGEPSAQLNVMPTPHPFWRNDKTMDASRFSRFGLTCAVLTANHGADLLTWYREVFLVRTSAQQEPARGLTESDQDCGVKWHESSVRFDPVSCSWKTAHCLWEEDLPWCSVTLPKWGSMRNGHVFQHPTLTRPISAIASGLWPTPNALPASTDLRLQCSGDGRSKPNKLGWAVAVSQRKWPTPVASMSNGCSPAALTRKDGQDRSNDRLDHAVMASDGGQLNPEWVEWLMGWPIGWTDLKPLAMDRFREWQQQHSPCSATEYKDAA